MIALNQEQTLGKKAYLLMASQKMTAGIVFLLIAVVLLFTNGIITSFIANTLKSAGASTGHTSADVSGVVMAIVAAAFILALFVCVIGLVVARLEYRNYTFTFEEFDLKLKRGIIGTKTISIPYRQMQDINIERSVLHQMTGTSRVVIDSAGHEEKSEQNETDIILEPIDREAAEDIRLMLQRKIGVQVVEQQKEADTEAGLPPQTA